ncbi:MAG: ATP-binding cassette domain-containing protein [Prevotellaceae bacterium]|jgi:ABC-2 type transport system ATP-binding protein|nr:ATP-binding cassette domain-containing protein [Prevotellaceae bacterium]
MSIHINRLSKKYGEQTVLDAIGFDVKEGEVVGFLGPNGAGKTTTMKIIAGSLPYDSGSVRICGREVKDHPIETKALIGYLPEQNPLYTEMYVKEYLLFVADAYRLGKGKNKQVDQLIDTVGLRPEFRKKIGQLSKGYRQRVGLAQALIPNPKVLLLDEPTTGLDPNQLEEIRTLIREIGKDRTVLFSTHIMQEIKAICNRVLIIHRGAIVADCSDLTTMSDGSSYRFEAEFLHPADVEALSDFLQPAIVRTKEPALFDISSATDIRANIFDFAVSSNNKLLTLRRMETSLEDIFRTLTK